MSQKNKTDLTTEVTSEIITNNNKQITAAQLQGILKDYIDSVPNWLSDAGRIGLKFYNTGTLYIPGDCIITASNAYDIYLLQCVTGTSETFAPGNWKRVDHGEVRKAGIMTTPLTLTNTTTPGTIIDVTYLGMGYAFTPLTAKQAEIWFTGVLNIVESVDFVVTVLVNNVPLVIAVRPDGAATNEIIEFRSLLTVSNAAGFSFVGFANFESTDWKIKARSTGPVGVADGAPIEIKTICAFAAASTSNIVNINQACINWAHRIE